MVGIRHNLPKYTSLRYSGKLNRSPRNSNGSGTRLSNLGSSGARLSNIDSSGNRNSIG